MYSTTRDRGIDLALAKAELAEAEFCLANLPMPCPPFIWDAAIDRVLAAKDELRRVDAS